MHRPPVEDQPTAEDRSMPVNRLKDMVELHRPAMSPWEAAEKFGTVDPAFTHLTTDSESSTPGRDSDGTGRVKSWTGDQLDPATSSYIVLVL